MKSHKISFVINICIIVFDIVAIVWMMSGADSGLLSGSKLAALKFFTVDSNILIGIAALIVAIDQGKVMKGKKDDISLFSYVAALTGTVGVTLTMLVTIFFLAPTMGAKYGLGMQFAKSGFFLHLVNPILSIVVLLAFERTDKIKFRYTFIGIIPLVIYAIYYTAEAFTHMENGVIAEGYDWYGFFAFGPNSVAIILPFIIAITYGISVLLWRLNRLKSE